MNSTILSLTGYTGLFNLGMVTGLGERKLKFKLMVDLKRDGLHQVIPI